MLQKTKGNEGFTLVELAIVLVIIGLILGAVLKGRDLIESARIKKIYSHFIEGWQLAIENYQDRTGQLLGDGIANGGTAATPDGWFDRINLATTTTVEDRLKAVGLSVPITNTGNPGSYYIKGKYYTRTVQAILDPLTSNGHTYNCIYIPYMPTDVAIALDTIIDGKADPASGLFRQYPTPTAGSQWPDASTTTYVNVMYIVK